MFNKKSVYFSSKICKACLRILCKVQFSLQNVVSLVAALYMAVLSSWAKILPLMWRVSLRNNLSAL